ncbi:MAG: hypothetical protein P0116_15940 [Candidatus Nitrosocosmicus sp.]|nr:hypothetical protein [Candidatus Nitrosocosmicus sp.]
MQEALQRMQAITKSKSGIRHFTKMLLTINKSCVGVNAMWEFQKGKNVTNKLTLNIGNKPTMKYYQLHFSPDGTIEIYDEGLQPASGKSSSVGVSPSRR